MKIFTEDENEKIITTKEFEERVNLYIKGSFYAFASINILIYIFKIVENIKGVI